MNVLIAVLVAMGAGFLLGALVVAWITFSVNRASAVKINEALETNATRTEDMRKEVAKLRDAIISLTGAVDVVIPILSDVYEDPDAAWALTSMNKAAKLALR